MDANKFRKQAQLLRSKKYQKNPLQLPPQIKNGVVKIQQLPKEVKYMARVVDAKLSVENQTKPTGCSGCKRKK